MYTYGVQDDGGAGAAFSSLMPGFVLFGVGSGLMNVPLTGAVLGAMPQERSGIASAPLNNSREVAGLLGVTVIGAVLWSRRGVALRHGVAPAQAFIDGYHAGLALTIALVALGAAVGYLALRRRTPRLPAGAGEAARGAQGAAAPAQTPASAPGRRGHGAAGAVLSRSTRPFG